jgi:hypothetical protein
MCASPSSNLYNVTVDEGPAEKAKEKRGADIPGPGPGQAAEDSLEEKFAALIPGAVDRARLEQFMEACGNYYKQTMAQVKESAIATPEDFLSTFGVWEKKHFSANERECPDRGKVPVSVCDSCGSRQGCPAWE